MIYAWDLGSCRNFVILAIINLFLYIFGILYNTIFEYTYNNSNNNNNNNNKSWLPMVKPER